MRRWSQEIMSPVSYRYRVVDVFTRVPLEGNPLAVFPDARGIDDETMQRIARELNLSETVFFEPTTNPLCACSFRIFTPTREMIFAGHPTVGACFVLLEEGLMASNVESFYVQEKIGPVKIRVESGDAPMIWLETPPIAFEESFDREACARALCLDGKDLLPDVQPQIVNAGNPTLLVALKDKNAVDRASVDGASYGALKGEGSKSFVLFVFTPTEDGAYSRMFAPEHGVVEDPATGSSTGPLGAFMKQHGLLPKSESRRFVSEQGTKMGRRSLLYFEIMSESGRDRIDVGGYVTPLIEGTMRF